MQYVYITIIIIIIIVIVQGVIVFDVLNSRSTVSIIQLPLAFFVIAFFNRQTYYQNRCKSWNEVQTCSSVADACTVSGPLAWMAYLI